MEDITESFVVVSDSHGMQYWTGWNWSAEREDAFWFPSAAMAKTCASLLARPAFSDIVVKSDDELGDE